MSEHKAIVTWSRNGRDFSYKAYSRDHLWKFENGIEVPASAAPDYLGNPQCVDPETAFVAALSSCHMLTFLAVASHKGFVVDAYEDHAAGHLEKNPQGKFAVTRVELRPKILFGGDKQPTPADLEWLHDKGSAQRRAGTRLRDATVDRGRVVSRPIPCASAGSDPQRGPSSARRRAPRMLYREFGDNPSHGCTCGIMGSFPALQRPPRLELQLAERVVNMACHNNITHRRIS